MKWLIPLSLLAALTLAPAHAAEISYEECIALVKTDADAALKKAQDWNNAGGGAAAAHCVAISLVALNRYPDAAKVLERIANDPTSGPTEARATVLAQAGNAWILAEEADKATTDLTRALEFTPGDIGIMFDRARAYLLAKKYKAALNDVNGVLLQTPSAGEPLLLRASIKKAMGDKLGAKADAQAALSDDRISPDAADVAHGILNEP